MHKSYACMLHVSYVYLQSPPCFRADPAGGSPSAPSTTAQAHSLLRGLGRWSQALCRLPSVSSRGCALRSNQEKVAEVTAVTPICGLCHRRLQFSMPLVTFSLAGLKDVSCPTMRGSMEEAL